MVRVLVLPFALRHGLNRSWFDVVLLVGSTVGGLVRDDGSAAVCGNALDLSSLVTHGSITMHVFVHVEGVCFRITIVLVGVEGRLVLILLGLFVKAFPVCDLEWADGDRYCLQDESKGNVLRWQRWS